MLKATVSMPSPVTAVDWSPKETGSSGAQVVAVGTEAGDVTLLAAASSGASVWNKLVAPARSSRTHTSHAPCCAPRYTTPPGRWTARTAGSRWYRCYRR